MRFALLLVGQALACAELQLRQELHQELREEFRPARWFSSSGQSLDLLTGSPINCLLLEEQHWSPPFLQAAHQKGLRVVAVLRRDSQTARAAALPFDAFALQGGTAPPGRPVIHLPPRRAIPFDSDAIIGTSQGVWPGIEIEHGGSKTAAPTGSAWINTNLGFLRFARAAAKSIFWMANEPPPGETYSVSRYLQAIAESAIGGVRWVVALDPAFQKRLLAADPSARAGWKRLLDQIAFHDQHAEWRQWPPASGLAIVQDAESGGLVTGNLLDMLSVMNTPVRALPSRQLTSVTLDRTRIVVTLDPAAYTAEQRALLAGFGGRVISGPANWRMPVPPGDRITFDRGEYAKLEAIWPELQLAVARKNFGVRLFNVAGVLSFLRTEPGGRRKLLELVNYTDYPVENVTAFVEGRFRKLTMFSADAPPRQLAPFDAPDGTGFEIDKLGVHASVVLEQ